ncbi:hypothetical protein IHC87_17345 [Photobacterium damselae subsp. damselae]|uniref:hypothetical protein n=1 Tax=Photobacterium damselae TaxID=38293 RepID=UPI001F2D95A1|nr:hypothetical protein [Photobacterium damselae]UJZ96333.1 hypothetical protein IHC87_17345 [Photobacterium damselae subsp. damselae]UJZ99763.1 hypothetical protein IHC88_20150 [Photobacterium damselae subsp. damselae]
MFKITIKHIVDTGKHIKDYSIHIEDLKFFGVLGFLCGFLIEVASYLPDHINRGLFSSLIFDHIPFYTIFCVFIVQFLSVILHQFIDIACVKDYLDNLVKYLSTKVGQFCSPAMWMMLGLSLSTFLISLYKGDLYVHYAKGFLLDAVIFFFIILISSQLKVGLQLRKGGVRLELAKWTGIGLVSAILIVFVFNTDPMSISYEVSVNEYLKIKQFATEHKQGVDELSQEAILKFIE